MMGSGVYSPIKLIVLVVVMLFVFLGVGFMLLMPAKLKTPPEKLNETLLIGEGCKVGGCNSEICQNAQEEEAVSICIYDPKYDCYKSSRCERQDSGKCAWTDTEESKSCLSKH